MLYIDIFIQAMCLGITNNSQLWLTMPHQSALSQKIIAADSTSSPDKK